MHKRLKPYIVGALLSFTLVYCFTSPKVKYTSLDIFSQLKIPYEINRWKGMDTDQEWNLEDEEYHFISQAFEREYRDGDNKSLFLLLLNAGNFHNPKVCYNGAGFKVQELEDIEFQVLDRTFKAHTLYAKNDAEGYVLVYWLCINKNTGGSFSELQLDFDDHDKAQLAGVRENGDRVAVSGMSTGSADQLYLALRVAAVEDFLDHAPPLPFIADDLFINFDDERAEAGIKVLAQLANKTQVLFFTHHQHLLDIARAAIGADASIISLPARAVAGESRTTPSSIAVTA